MSISPTDEHTIAESRYYLPFIDGLRGIAILLVVLCHVNMALWYSLPESQRHLSPLVDVLVISGGRGVELFFLVSAFTLFSSSNARFKSEAYPKLYFYVRRAFRILPFWWIAITYSAYVNKLSLSSLTPYYFMYYGYKTLLPEPISEPVLGAWTIFTEESFYFFLPLIFGFVTNAYRATLAFTATAFASFIWIAAIGKQLPYNANGFPLVYWPFFCLGILVYFIYRSPIVLEKIMKAEGSPKALDLLAFILLLNLFTAPTRFTGVIALTAVFIASFSECSFFGKLTRLKALKRLGAYCYSIYLGHWFIINHSMRWMKSIASALNWNSATPYELKLIVWSAMILALCFVFGAISFRFIEKPCVQAGKKLLSQLDRFLIAKQKGGLTLLTKI